MESQTRRAAGRSLRKALTVILLPVVVFAAFAGKAYADLNQLTTLKADRVDSVACTIYGGTGAGMTWSLDRPDYAREINGLVGMFSRIKGDYVPRILPLRADYSLTYLDREGNKLLSVYVSGEVIRVGTSAYRWKKINTEAWFEAYTAAKKAGFVRYPGTN